MLHNIISIWFGKQVYECVGPNKSDIERPKMGRYRKEDQL